MSVRDVKNPLGPQLLIAEAAAVLGVTQVTLRRWDSSGRFRPRRHPINGYRLYDAAAVLKLRAKIRGGLRAAS